MAIAAISSARWRASAPASAAARRCSRASSGRARAAAPAQPLARRVVAGPLRQRALEAGDATSWSPALARQLRGLAQELGRRRAACRPARPRGGRATARGGAPAGMQLGDRARRAWPPRCSGPSSAQHRLADHRVHEASSVDRRRRARGPRPAPRRPPAARSASSRASCPASRGLAAQAEHGGRAGERDGVGRAGRLSSAREIVAGPRPAIAVGRRRAARRCGRRWPARRAARRRGTGCRRWPRAAPRPPRRRRHAVGVWKRGRRRVGDSGWGSSRSPSRRAVSSVERPGAAGRRPGARRPARSAGRRSGGPGSRGSAATAGRPTARRRP